MSATTKEKNATEMRNPIRALLPNSSDGRRFIVSGKAISFEKEASDLLDGVNHDRFPTRYSSSGQLHDHDRRQHQHNSQRLDRAHSFAQQSGGEQDREDRFEAASDDGARRLEILQPEEIKGE